MDMCYVRTARSTPRKDNKRGVSLVKIKAMSHCANSRTLPPDILDEGHDNTRDHLVEYDSLNISNVA